MPGFTRQIAAAGLTAASYAGMTSTALAQSDPAKIAALVLGSIVAMALILTVVFVPTIIAFRRGHPNRWLIFVGNFILGGTGIGWFVMLIWAVQELEDAPDDDEAGPCPAPLPNTEPTIFAATKADTEDATRRLKRLKVLFDDGVLSADEYAALRKPLLNAPRS